MVNTAVAPYSAWRNKQYGAPWAQERQWKGIQDTNTRGEEYTDENYHGNVENSNSECLGKQMLSTISSEESLIHVIIEQRATTKLLEEDGTMLLGSPIGSAEFWREVISVT